MLPFAGNPDDWHQLDHYTAATVVLNQQSHPIAIIPQPQNDRLQLSDIFNIDSVLEPFDLTVFC